MIPAKTIRNTTKKIMNSKEETVILLVLQLQLAIYTLTHQSMEQISGTSHTYYDVIQFKNNITDKNNCMDTRKIISNSVNFFQSRFSFCNNGCALAFEVVLSLSAIGQTPLVFVKFSINFYEYTIV